MKRLQFAVLVPAHNEEHTIHRVVQECMKDSEFVLVVDDGSTDKTGALARNAGARILRNSRRRGLGWSLRRGLRYLSGAGFEAVVTLDGDGAHDPSYIPGMLNSHYIAQADLTIGTRFSKPTEVSSVPSSKVAANFFAACLINHIFDCNLSDVASGMRVFGKRALELRFHSSDFAISYEFITAALRNGLRINEYSIGVRYNANELFCTNRRELLNLLDFAIRYTPKDRHVLRKCVLKARSMVANYRRVRISINDTCLVLYPLRQHKAYVFQFQNQWYVVISEKGSWLVIA